MKQEINCVYYYVQQSSLLHRWKWLVKDQIVFYEWTFIKCLHTCDNHDLLCRHLAVFCSTSVIGLSFEQSYANGTLALGTLPFSISKKRGWNNCTLITGLSDESMSDRWPNCAQRSDCQARQSLMMTLWHGYRVRKSKTHRITFFFKFILFETNELLCSKTQTSVSFQRCSSSPKPRLGKNGFDHLVKAKSCHQWDLKWIEFFCSAGVYRPLA